MSRALASASAARLDTDVVVVGAGVAGLAAVAALRAHGLGVVVLEAGRRIGGRAWTDAPPVLGGVPFDHGAQWLHAAESNPLVPLAASRGEPVRPDRRFEARLSIVGPGDPAADYAAAADTWHAAVTARLNQPDMSLAEAASDLVDDPWLATLEAWEGAIIAAADADVLSLRDWALNELEGRNFVAPGGLGAMLARLLGAAAGDIRLGATVTGVALERGGVLVSSTLGDIRAGAALVTVSTGVLRAGRIGFSPGLPGDVLAALDGLPMGLLSKVALPAASAGRLGLPADAEVFDRLTVRGAPFMPMMMWPDGQGMAVGFIGGRAAWALAPSPGEAAAFMRDELRRLLGGAALGAFRPDAALATEWGTDPLFLGSYAYARPGHAGARKALGRPLWDGRLQFAGEACATDGRAGTVAGAYLSGADAAARLARGFTTRPEPV